MLDGDVLEVHDLTGSEHNRFKMGLKSLTLVRWQSRQKSVSKVHLTKCLRRKGLIVSALLSAPSEPPHLKRGNTAYRRS
jgi:hypothetical protein